MTGNKLTSHGLFTISYYNMGAVDTAKLLYQAGWTESYKSGNYGLKDLIRILINYYGMGSTGDIIKLFKEVGLSPLVIANCMNGLSTFDFGLNINSKGQCLFGANSNRHYFNNAFN